ncbi:MAG: RnfABCDGE type electron transport complex subunit D [Acidimicrobiia bacterium]|nr:RnfABCDGE type electron transport complex subunit D [Acidimicrobiia bacterium]
MTVDSTAGGSIGSTIALGRLPGQATVGSVRLSPARASVLPLVFALALLACGLVDAVRQHPRLWWSFLGAGVVLVTWSAILFCRAQRTVRTLVLEVAPRKQHYVQACAQSAVLLYWGWHWREVYGAAPLIAGQLAFAYAFDMLFSWSRRDTYTLGFAPLPVIFSINLFLWFKPDWFYLQFLMVALGFAAKDLIRWDKDGRRAHVFNPSSFPLAVFSMALLLTGMSDATWGRDIAITQFFPPHVYVVLFLVGLPGQYLFGVTSMTMSAVVTTYLFGLVYFALTGTYFFLDSYIPIAVFLGMHLLFTDPSTSPRTELGRLLFGAAYGLSTVLLYQLLSAAGQPTFYDKLLQVPILNLSIKGFDRAARSRWLRGLDPAALGRHLAPRRRHLAYMAVWAVVFGGMWAAEGVGDTHRGQWLPFWQQACESDRPTACAYLAGLESRACEAGSGWACNEYALLQSRLRFDGPGPAASLRAGCARGFEPACRNYDRLANGDPPVHRAPPLLPDLPIVLRGSKGPITGLSPPELHERACAQGWQTFCGGPEPFVRSGDPAVRDRP